MPGVLWRDRLGEGLRIMGGVALRTTLPATREFKGLGAAASGVPAESPRTFAER
jgi:hypothetical protein